MRRVSVVAAAVAIAASVAGEAQASGEPLLVRAGANFQRVGGFLVRSDPTYRGAIQAFGNASSCRLVRGSPANAIALWRSIGVRISLVTYGGMPEGETGCTAPDLIHIDRITLTGKRWRTARGLKVGDSGYRLRQLYRLARYRHLGASYFPNSYFLVQVRQRCRIGDCTGTPFLDVPRLVARMRDGRVSAIVVPVGAQGE